MAERTTDAPRVLLTVPHAASHTDTGALAVAHALQTALAARGVRTAVVASRVDRAVMDDNRWPAARAPSELHRQLRDALHTPPAARPHVLVDVHGYPRSSVQHPGWAAAPFAALLFTKENPPSTLRGGGGDGARALAHTRELFGAMVAGAEAGRVGRPVEALAQSGMNSVTEVGLGAGVPSVLLEFPFEADGSVDRAIHAARTAVAPAVASMASRLA